MTTLKKLTKAAAAAASIALSGSMLFANSAAVAQTTPDTYAQLDTPSFSVIVKLTVLPEQRENFLRAMKARITDSRLHPSVVDFRILATTDPLVFMGYESFTDRAAFDAFAKTPQSKAFLAAMKSVLAKDVEANLLAPLP